MNKSAVIGILIVVIFMMSIAMSIKNDKIERLETEVTDLQVSLVDYDELKTRNKHLELRWNREDRDCDRIMLNFDRSVEIKVKETLQEDRDFIKQQYEKLILKRMENAYNAKY